MVKTAKSTINLDTHRYPTSYVKIPVGLTPSIKLSAIIPLYVEVNDKDN